MGETWYAKFYGLLKIKIFKTKQSPQNLPSDLKKRIWLRNYLKKINLKCFKIILEIGLITDWIHILTLFEV